MPQVTVEKTLKYLIVKIPLRAFKAKKAEISSKGQNLINKAINEGLADFAAGRFSGPFKTVREFKKSLAKLDAE